MFSAVSMNFLIQIFDSLKATLYCNYYNMLCINPWGCDCRWIIELENLFFVNQIHNSKNVAVQTHMISFITLMINISVAIFRPIFLIPIP